MRSIRVATHTRSELIDITDQIAAIVAENGAGEGMCLVHSPHTTCGITVNEDADPDVRRDILKGLDTIVPWEQGFLHGEGNSAAHIKTSLMGTSTLIPISEGRLALGRWQGIYLCEFDGPRHRSVQIQVIT